MHRGFVGWLLVVVQFALLIGLVLLPRRELTLLGLFLGVPVMAAGVLLGVLAMRHLGTALTPTPVPIEGAALRTDGPYRVVRHPIYSAILLLASGYALLVGTVWTWLGVVVLALFFLAKSRWEDRMLAHEHGVEWTAWAQSTGALVPRVSRKTRQG